MRVNLFTIAAAALLVAPPAMAQSGQTGVLTGTVVSVSGTGLSHAVVTLTADSVGGGPRSGVTDQRDRYVFPGLPPGSYEVTAELPGFQSASQEIRLRLGQTITLVLRLRDTGGAEPAVAGPATRIDAPSPAADKHLDIDLLESVPIESRLGAAAITLAPGINPTTSAAYGSGGVFSNAYVMDGLDTTDPQAGGAWVFTSYNWIQEVQVVALGADAEHGGFTVRDAGSPAPRADDRRIQRDKQCGDHEPHGAVRHDLPDTAGTCRAPPVPYRGDLAVLGGSAEGDEIRRNSARTFSTGGHEIGRNTFLNLVSWSSDLV